MDSMAENNFKIVMFPWFAIGHFIPFLDLSNKLASKGHQVFFLVPKKSQIKVEKFNLHPKLVKFVPLDVPQVHGLPHDAETTSDVHFKQNPLLLHAIDLTRPKIESLLREIKPHFVFLDTVQYWLPSFVRSLGIKSIAFLVNTTSTASYFCREGRCTLSGLMKPPPDFPSSGIALQTHEARELAFIANIEDKWNGISFVDRLTMTCDESDALCFRACREIEGPYIKFLETKSKKPIILSGPALPKLPSSGLEEKWENWLNKFPTKKVIYCAFGSECKLQYDQFQEILLGLELSGLPFLAALKPPLDANEVEEALPEGFKERTRERGIVYGGWIQQQHILAHPSVGCYILHCGTGSVSEALVSECQIVLLPMQFDQCFTARLLGADMKVGIEIEKDDENGHFTKESVSNAIRLVMDEKSEVANEVRANHAKLRKFLLTEDLESNYTNEFVRKVQELY